MNKCFINEPKSAISDLPHKSRNSHDVANSGEYSSASLGNILRLAQVCKKTGISKSGIYDAISKGTFPSQIRLSQRRVGWYEPHVDRWIRARIESGVANH